MLFKTGSSTKRFFISRRLSVIFRTWCDICNGALPWAARDLKESLDHIGEKEDWEKAHFLPCHLCFWLWVSLRLTPKSNGCIQKYQMFLRKCFSKPNIVLHFFGLTCSALHSLQHESLQWVTIEYHCLLSLRLINDSLSCAREVAREVARGS